MDFAPTQTQAEWQARARRFAAEAMAPFAGAWDDAGEFPLECFRRAGVEGFTGLCGPREAGGAGVDALTATLVFEALAQGCFATAFGLVVHNNFVRSLARSGTEGARARWLGPAVRGELLGAFALTEPEAGSDAAAISTTAVAERGGWRLRGVKAWVSNGGVADLYNVMARTDPGAGARGISSIVVERDRAGLSFGPRDRKLGAGALPTCRMVLDDVWVPADHLLGVAGGGFQGALAAIDLARAFVGAMGAGIGQTALDAAVAYASTRRAFGRPIAEFQGLQFLLADLACRIEAARWLAYRAAWLLDRGEPAGRACAIAKRVGTHTAEEVSRHALEVFGAAGLLRDHPVERCLRWAKVAAFLDGTTQIQQVVIARDLLRR